MSFKCEYCECACAEGATKCVSCGAPISADASAPDYRFCPFCRRRLLSLGSASCNYCGRALPASYVKARGETLRRIRDASEGGASESDLEKLENESDDAMRRALKSLFELDGKSKRK